MFPLFDAVFKATIPALVGAGPYACPGHPQGGAYGAGLFSPNAPGRYQLGRDTATLFGRGLHYRESLIQEVGHWFN